MKNNRKSAFLLLAILLIGHRSYLQIRPNTDTVVALSALSIPIIYDASIKLNYVRTWDARRAVTDTTNLLLNGAYFKESTQYFDGLGRPIQTVIKGGTYNDSMDIVTMNLYDSFGREKVKYLAFPKSGATGKFNIDPFTAQQAFYNTSFHDQRPLATYSFEPSPLNRNTFDFAPGNDWTGATRGVEHQYLLNSQADSVRIATCTGRTSALPSFGNIYLLSCNWFKDIYYHYTGNLSFPLPPGPPREET